MKYYSLAAILLGLSVSISYSQWQIQTVATKSDFRGLCIESPNVAWVSGTKGTYARTTDGGKTWTAEIVPGAEKLDFRDVEAFGENTAYLLSIGSGDASRIYKTVDGGKSWTMQFKNADPLAFFDAIAFWDEQNGIAFGDPVNGQFQLLVTTDGGANWKVLVTKNLPPALAGEGGFAASGTCIVTHGESDVWFATGGAKTARVFHSRDRGQNWVVSETPIAAGIESAGIFSIAFRDRQHGMIVGGDYRKPNDVGATAALTDDGGKTWKALEKQLPFRSGVAWAKDRWVAVGTSGSHDSVDNGATWKQLDRENYNSVGFTPTGEGWAVGPKGRIAKFAKSIGSTDQIVAQSSIPKLIAHRGASAYAPEHTLEAYRLALTQGADLVEPDLQITKDGVLVCLHDTTLERTTNVANVFPDRAKQAKGKKTWPVSDFTLAEIRQLDAGSWMDAKFAGAKVPTFQEMIDVVRGHAGIIPETKAPENYAKLGMDMDAMLMAALKDNRLDQPGADPKTPVVIQSFSAASLKALRQRHGCKLPLVFLIGDKKTAAEFGTAEGLKKVRDFADGVGPNKTVLLDRPDLVKDAHALGMSVTVWTFRSGQTGKFADVGQEMNYFLRELKVDAVFTDNPDKFPRK